jgi:hypothetical protein
MLLPARPAKTASTGSSTIIGTRNGRTLLYGLTSNRRIKSTTARNNFRRSDLNSYILIMLGETVNLEKQTEGERGKMRLEGCVLGSLLVAGVILFCIIVRNGSQLERLDLPSDSKFKTCSLDFSHSYPLLYIDLQSQ